MTLRFYKIQKATKTYQQSNSLNFKNIASLVCFTSFPDHPIPGRKAKLYFPDYLALHPVP